MEQNLRFKNYVTSTAFSLTLSRAMCDALEYLIRSALASGFRELQFVPQLTSMHSLERRGLVLSNPWRLTEAGLSVYPLLELAGLVTPMLELQEYENKVRMEMRRHASG